MTDIQLLHSQFASQDCIANNHLCFRSAGIDPSVFDTVPTTDPYILKSNVSNGQVESPYGTLNGPASYAYHLSQHQPVEVPGGGGTISIVDSRNFPAASTIAAAVVVLKPGALRELHWHPNVRSFLSSPLRSSPLHPLHSPYLCDFRKIK